MELRGRVIYKKTKVYSPFLSERTLSGHYFGVIPPSNSEATAEGDVIERQ